MDDQWDPLPLAISGTFVHSNGIRYGLRYEVLQVRPTWRSREVDIAEITVAISNSAKSSENFSIWKERLIFNELRHPIDDS